MVNTFAKLVLEKKFLDQASLLNKDVKIKLLKCLQNLVIDTNYPGLQTKKVKGSKFNLFECRVDRNIRLIYDRDGDNLRCWFIGEHDDTLNKASSNCIFVDDIEIFVESQESHQKQSQNNHKYSKKGTVFIQYLLAEYEDELLRIT